MKAVMGFMNKHGNMFETEKDALADEVYQTERKFKRLIDDLKRVWSPALNWRTDEYPTEEKQIEVSKKIVTEMYNLINDK